jgi:hypothetical protein
MPGCSFDNDDRDEHQHQQQQQQQAQQQEQQQDQQTQDQQREEQTLDELRAGRPDGEEAEEGTCPVFIDRNGSFVEVRGVCLGA